MSEATATTSKLPAEREPSNVMETALRLLRERNVVLTAVAVGLFTFFSLQATNFFTTDNVYDMGRVSAFMLIVAVPMTFIFITGEIDISVGSLYGFCAVFMGLCVVNWDMSVWMAALCTVAMGGFVGAINGFVTQVVGVPSIVQTLAMYSLLRGIGNGITGGQPLLYPSDLQSSFFSIANGTVAGVPAQIFWGLGVLLLGGFVLRFTKFGAHLYATGGNERAAAITGIKTLRVKFTCFMLSGLACGLIAALQGGWLKEGNAATGSGFELQVIAAVIIGGVAITGGEGSVYGTLLGVIIIGILPNGLVLMNVDANWNEFYVGLLIAVVATSKVVLGRREDLHRWMRRMRQRWRSQAA